jgi:DNA polymerase I
MSTEKKLFLLDAYALIFRAYYAFINNPIRNSKGLNTSAIYGFTNSLLDVITNEKPTHIAVAFDFPGPTFRHKMFPEYKANRDATPEDIKLSVPYIKEIIRAFNIPILELEGYEADDIIGTFAKKASKENFNTFMMTPDKDYGQLVSDNTFIYKPKRSGGEVEIIGPEEIKEKYGINDPDQVIDILALMGDSADNIPGAPGVGEKTAIKLLGQYETVENLLEHTSELKGKQKERIEENVEQIKLSKILATIKIDVPLNFSETELKISPLNISETTKIFTELEFKNILNKISQTKSEKQEISVSQPTLFDNNPDNSEGHFKYDNLSDISSVDHKYYLVDNKEDRIKLLNNLLNQKEVCFDTETTSLNIFEAKIIGISFSYVPREAFFVPIPIEDGKIIIDDFLPFFNNNEILKIGQNIKYDIQVLKNYNVNVAGNFFDTMIAHYLLQPDQRHNIDFLSENYLSYKKVSTESLIGKKGKSQLNMTSVSLDQLSDYACEDADITFQLKPILFEELNKNNLFELYKKIESPLINVLAKMERNGVRLDEEALNKYAADLRSEVIEVEKSILADAGVEFNVSSPKQLGEVLFDRMKIDPNAKRTKSKQYSTAEDVLTRLQDKHPIINKILDYRSLRKLLSTYVEALPKLINSKTNRVHTSFNQTIAATGRLSSTNPNMQNIPIREDRGKEIRKSFIPSDNEHEILSADYSQIELRLMAHLSQDKNMVEAFNNNEDIHASTAAKINKINIKDVSSEMRSQAKVANFGIIYGISAFGLSQRLHIPRTEAKNLIENYFETFPSVKLYMDESIRLARNEGIVKTIFGRKRYLPDINSRNAIVRGNAERNAINAPIQGSAADIIKIAMINIHNELNKRNLKSQMVLQVHDELIFNVLKSESEEIKDIVISLMENAVEISVPLLVDYGIGKNWLEAHS